MLEITEKIEKHVTEVSSLSADSMDKSREGFLLHKMNSVVSDLRAQGSVIVAFSGGVDSSLAAKLACLAVGKKAVAVTTDSITLPPGELEEAERVAKEIGIEHIIAKINELDNPDFAKNATNRCYYCKKQLSFELKKIARERGIDTIIAGVIADDLRGHRPGVKALREEGIHIPLAEAGFTKQDVRDLCKMLGLSVADKPSMACLSSRISYGEEITEEKLRRVANAEVFIKQLLGTRQLRVRVHGDLARVEVSEDERHLFFETKTLDAIYDKLKELGFLYVTLDMGGYRSGSLDEPLKSRNATRLTVIH